MKDPALEGFFVVFQQSRLGWFRGIALHRMWGWKLVLSPQTSDTECS
jgi:hypothetical protein